MGSNNIGTYIHELNSDLSRDIRTFDPFNDIPFVEFMQDIDLDCSYYDEQSFADSFSSTKNILILSLNIQSLQSKFLSFTNLIDNFALTNSKPDFILLQETFVSDIFHFNIKGFRAILNCRPPGSRGGGTAIFLNDSYDFKHLSNDAFFIPHILESSVVQVIIPGKSKFLLISLY